jgi:branched-chain amino acid transport system ATP-binding protein
MVWVVAMTLLSARRLSKYFGGLRAVDEVNFELETGEIRAIIGPNGAGKTTFVSLLCGRLEATDGSIIFENQDITGLPAFKRARQGIAYTFQITSIYSKLSVRENVAIAAQNATDKSRDAAYRVQDALTRSGIPELADEIAGSLAYGHQRVLEVAMGLAMSPKLLILDEPTQGLSDMEIEQFCELVSDINNTATVLLIEHNMHVVMKLAQRITVMDRGRVLAEGLPEEIRRNDAVQAAYLGS